MDGWIYFVEHRNSGIVYVGKTVQLPRERWSVHRWTAKVKPTSYFERALAKHGPDAFEWWVGEHYSSSEETKQAEIAWIAYLRSQGAELYNRTDGGDGTPGWVPTKETRRRISEARRGKATYCGPRKPLSKEHRMKLSKAGKGKPKSEEHRRKLGESQRGIPAPQRGQPGINNEMRRQRRNES